MSGNWILLVNGPKWRVSLGYSDLTNMDTDEFEIYESKEKAIEHARLFNKQGYNNIYICRIVPDTKLTWSEQPIMEKL